MKPLNLFLIAPAILVIGVVFSGCSSKPKEPTKETAVGLLNELCDNLLQGELRAAADLMHTPPGMDEAEKVMGVAKFLELREISTPGIKILAEKGNWGKFDDIWPERGERIANKWSLEIENCWALLYENAEAGFYWDGKGFQIIRCDDIGKLL